MMSSRGGPTILEGLSLGHPASKPPKNHPDDAFIPGVQGRAKLCSASITESAPTVMTTTSDAGKYLADPRKSKDQQKG